MTLSHRYRILIMAVLALSACTSATQPDRNEPVRNDSAATISVGDHVARSALNLVGTPYVYGGSSPEGFDCSGLVQYVHEQAGVKVPRTSRAQFDGGVKVSQLQTGDVLFFRIGGKVSHSGIYIGDGRFVHAPSSGKQVSVAYTDSPYFQSRLVGARRYISQPRSAARASLRPD